MINLELYAESVCLCAKVSTKDHIFSISQSKFTQFPGSKVYTYTTDVCCDNSLKVPAIYGFILISLCTLIDFSAYTKTHKGLVTINMEIISLV